MKWPRWDKSVEPPVYSKPLLTDAPIPQGRVDEQDVAAYWNDPARLLSDTTRSTVDQAKEDRFHGLEEQTLIGGDTLSGLADWCGKLQIHPGAQVLDLGCGSGAHSLMWQGMSQHLDLGFGHYVMDHAPGAVDVASTRLWGSPNAMPNHRAVGCASTITEAFPGMQFDVIFTNTVLQHNSGWKQDKIIPEIRRALDDDGVLILWTEKTFSYWEDRQMEHLLTPDYCDDRQSAGTAMWWIQRFAEFRFELLFYYHGRYAYRKSA